MNDFATLLCRHCRIAVVTDLRLTAQSPGLVARGQLVVWNEATAQASDSYGEPVREDLDGWYLVHREDLVAGILVAGAHRRCPQNHAIGRAEPDVHFEAIALDPRAIVVADRATWVRPRL